MIRVALPPQLRTLAGTPEEVRLEISGAVTPRSVLDVLELRYPVLRGTIRDHHTRRRRPYVRFYACQQDWSHRGPDEPLPEAVAHGSEPFVVLGALSGG